MTTIDFIIELFCRIDDAMPNAKKHTQANLRPSEVVTLAILFALKGVGNRAFYRWIVRDYKIWFPKLPERTLLVWGAAKVYPGRRFQRKSAPQTTLFRSVA